MTYLLADEIAAHTRLLLAPPLGHLDTMNGALLHGEKNDCRACFQVFAKFTLQDTSPQALALA
ncbi:hypothetical protein PsyrCH409_04800 [Pseudomonas viridiflava]|nr:hypothetical protein BB779_18220 [Pseudomonas viridiflava]PCK93407.1 hypothetical protein PsyrCH409_04800 [Pseudomonas viridiflava]TKJ64891.1 hypothetical protein PviCFBP13507_13570 [Pseudomonas viridiflava]TKK25155.1 hypothetical protein PviCFBP13515_17445 [Pseudomonas viridiflava]